jgi:hypothetical protein
MKCEFEASTMKPNLHHMLLAWASMLTSLAVGARAAEMSYSGLDKRLALPNQSDMTDYTMPTIALLSYGRPTEGQPPIELGGSNFGSTSTDSDVNSEPCECGKTDCRQDCEEPISGVYFADVQLFFMRTHVLESAVGKLSEKYELAPRFILGYEGHGGVGSRVRYWTYGRWTPNLGGGDALRVDMDVIDLETTCRFRTARTDLVIAGGLRWTDMGVALGADAVEIEMPGATVAADMRVAMCRSGCREWAAVGGARWSMLGGDWEGSGGFINPVRDDNVVVQEIYGGFEYFRVYRDYDLFARVIFEAQNWHSDAAAQDAGADSIGFVGPGLEIGMMF